MSILDSILKSKSLSPWQEEMSSRGIVCPECGCFVEVTAPVSDDADMVRLHCDSCGYLNYETKPRDPVIIDFEKAKRVFGGDL